MEDIELQSPKDRLIESLQLEVISRDGKKKFTWFRCLHRVAFSYKKRFYFWWRIAQYLHTSPSNWCRKRARRIQDNLRRKYSADISVSADIAPGMKINHYVSIVIRNDVVIGRNVQLRQNTTLGHAGASKLGGKMIIGDNVSIGAHALIIGNIKIGNNVDIGAGAFVNKDIPDNTVVRNEVVSVQRTKLV